MAEKILFALMLLGAGITAGLYIPQKNAPSKKFVGVLEFDKDDPGFEWTGKVEGIDFNFGPPLGMKCYPTTKNSIYDRMDYQICHKKIPSYRVEER